ncbi:MAG: outer membrane protein [Desulfovibrio sp.]
MKKLFSAMLLSAALLLPCFAQAGSGVYVTPKLVMNYQHNKSEISVAGMHAMSDSKSSFRAGAAIAVGYNFMEVFSQPLRAEAEYGFYGKNSLTRHYDAGPAGSGSVTSKFGVQTLLANGYWDFARFSGFVPWVSAGVGLAFVNDKTSIHDGAYHGMNNETDVVFAGQVGFGCAWEVNSTLSLDLGYRYLMMANTQTSAYEVTMRGKHNHNHQIMLGARISF